MTEAPRTPDQLDDLERRVYDLAVQPMPLAEIAVRLGVSIRQADDKIQRLCGHLGVADREALRAMAGIPTPFEVPEEDETDYGVLDTEPDPGPSPGLTRRKLVIGGASLAVLAGSAAVGWRLSSGGTQPLGPVATQTPEAPIRIIPIPGGTTTFAEIPVVSEPGRDVRFEKAGWSNGADVDWTHGMFRTRPGSGSLQGFRFLSAAESQDGDAFQNYSISPGGRYVWAQNGLNVRGYVADWDDDEHSWSWAFDELRLVTAYHNGTWGYLLFEHVTGLNWQGTGRYSVAQPGLGPQWLESVGDFSLGGMSLGTASLQDGRGRVALWSSNGSTDLRLNEVDLTTAKVTNTLVMPPAFEGLKNPQPGPLERFGGGHLLAKWLYRDPDGGPARVVALVLPWQSTEPWKPDGQISLDYGASMDLEGRIVETIPTREAWIEEADGGREFWPEVRVRPLEPKQSESFRFLSASTSYGDSLPANRWLADGSGFVAMVRGPETDGSNLDAYEYAIIQADGRTVTRIPLPPAVGEPRWWNQNSIRGPVPSPYNPNYISFGRTDLYNVQTGEWFRPNLTSEPGPDHLDPWAAGPEFMVFALPHGGHGGAPPPVLLNPKFEEPPYARVPFAFVVANTGDSLRLRAAPSLDAGIIANLPDGTDILLDEDPDRPVGLRAVDRADGILWVRVRTLDDQAGWVSSTYLAWK